MSKVLITGIDGFTGIYLEALLNKAGYDVFGLVYPKSVNNKHIVCNITNKQEIVAALESVRPDYIVHLAGISFVAHKKITQIYNVNFFGSINILDALVDVGLSPRKVILPSSSNVYGTPQVEVVDETICPSPVSHYANSKLAMEFIAKTYFDRLNILITRPFNYTGIGQSGEFLVPKVIRHFKERKQEIELGNLNVVRDFLDVRVVADVYKNLMECGTASEIVNICSGIGVSLMEIIENMNVIAGYEIRIIRNIEFIRDNEVITLIGSNKKLISLIGSQEVRPFKETLRWMFEAL
jgi:nucleoside-diphosphate-sugar epimerase